MKKVLATVLLLVLVSTTAFAKDNETRIKVNDQDHKGVPTFVTGELGKLAAGSLDKAAKAFLKSQKALLKQMGTEDFDVVSTHKDHLGRSHVKMQQTLRGLPVIGAEYIIHSDEAGNVYAMNGRFAADEDLPRIPTFDSVGAAQRAIAQLGISNARFLGGVSLTYVVNEKSNATLAWTARVSYTDREGRDQISRVYADAATGDIVLVAPEFKYARNRSTYTANNGTSLPGTLKRSETSANIGDVALDAAHNYAGNVYDFYKNVFGRDSYDGAGAAIKSSVHYSTAYNNAFWNGSQMVYGDGDGTNFVALSRSLDVDAHELTHAVTERTANLVYQNESGALNEAMSDILGSACEAYTNNGGTPNANTWLLGEDIYTPATAGDALRYINDPARAGDYDYYPTRYTGTADYGGVHTNSGIANLAFYLMVAGGTHPRGKTTVVVPALGATPAASLDMAQRIFYRALTTYLTSSSNFAAARTATAQAATDLYGATANAAVHKAWDAVGAPGGATPPATTTVLTNGVAQTSLSGATGSWKHFKIAVPTGQTKLDIVQSLGTGDADLYVKRGAQPTSSVYDYRPYLGGNAETVSVTNPVAGDWYISIYAYAAYSGLSLKATYTGTVTPPACTSSTGTFTAVNQTLYSPSSTGYASSISGTHTAKLTGPAGTDFDLYLQKLSGTTWANVGTAGETSTSTENVSYAGTAGTYRWRIYSYSGTGTYTICTTKP